MIRSIDTADCEAIAAIEAQTFSTALSRDRLLDFLKKSVFCGFVCDLDVPSSKQKSEGLAGYLLAMTIVDEAEILSIAVIKDRQKYGRGTALLGCFLDYIEAKGVKNVVLEVASDNMPALRLYHRHGFMEFGRRNAYYNRVGGYCDAIMMKRACY